MVIRNRSDTDVKLPKNTNIGSGLEIKLEDLPFMSNEQIKTLNVDNTSESVKEKSRKDFLKKIKHLDPDLQKVLIRYTGMFLDANPIKFWTLDIKKY